MKNLLSIACCSLAGLSLLVAGTARGQETGFYVRADAGPALTDDVKVRDFLGTPNAGKLKFDTGVRFDIAGGYSMTKWLDAEFETGVIRNYIKDQHNSSLSSVPMMVNLTFKAPVTDRIVPFIGGGAGGVISVLDADDLGGVVEGTDSTAVFGWQGFGGVRVFINDHFSVNLAYRYLESQSPSWDVRPDRFIGFNDTRKIQLDHIRSHAIVLGADFHF